MKAKRCPRCGETKPLTAFWRNRTKADGLESWCKPCHYAAHRDSPKVKAAKARWARANRAQENERKRRWERENARPCADCGESTSDPYGERCDSCERRRRYEQARKQTARLLALRRQGLANWQIAEREGVTPHVVATALQRRSVARFPELEWVRGPYLRRVAP